MKLAYRDIEPFIKKIPPTMRAILVYGPDQGLVEERSLIIARQVTSDLADPFNAVHLSGATIAADPVRFDDEVTAQSLLGGRRLVRITNAGNEIAAPLKIWLRTSPNPDCVVVISAGDMKPKDALRKICEELVNAAAVPCYQEDEKALGQLIRSVLQTYNLAMQPDALAWFAGSIKGDRLQARMELEKLLLYMNVFAAEKPQQKNITMFDVQNSAGLGGQHTIDDLVYAFANRDRNSALQLYKKLESEGVAEIALIRSLENHLFRLQIVKSDIEQKKISLETAVGRLQPQIFFKQAEQFAAQVKNFSSAQLQILLFKINELETKIKKTGAPVQTLLNDFLLHAF